MALGLDQPTAILDSKSKKTLGTNLAYCQSDGRRGLALDTERHLSDKMHRGRRRGLARAVSFHKYNCNEGTEESEH